MTDNLHRMQVHSNMCRLVIYIRTYVRAFVLIVSESWMCGCEWWDCVARRAPPLLTITSSAYTLLVRNKIVTGADRIRAPYIQKRCCASLLECLAALCELRPRCDLNLHIHGNQMAKTERESACTMLIQFFFLYARLWWDCWHRRKVKFRTCWRCAPAGKWVMPPGGGQEETCVYGLRAGLIGDFGRWKGGDFEITSFYLAMLLLG
jgi:hypothetical protein